MASAVAKSMYLHPDFGTVYQYSDLDWRKLLRALGKQGSVHVELSEEHLAWLLKLMEGKVDTDGQILRFERKENVFSGVYYALLGIYSGLKYSKLTDLVLFYAGDGITAAVTQRAAYKDLIMIRFERRA